MLSLLFLGALSVGAVSALNIANVTVSALNIANVTTPANRACAALVKQYPNVTYFPASSQYHADNTDFWSATCELGPACVFAPSNPQDLGAAVKVLRKHKAPFAMKGGGHTPIEGFNNINSTGVLLSSSGFSQLELSQDKKSVHIGPGNHWGDVWKYLEPSELTIAGGRLGVVGVPGLVLGGGMSFLSWEYGWSAANVKSLTAVLASGEVVKLAAEGQYSDLFWAVRGGGNSFALITDLEMYTFASPVVTVGTLTYGTNSTVKNKWLDAIYNFAHYGSNEDFKATVVPTANGASTGITYTTIGFYNGNNTSPSALSNFTAPILTPTNTTFAPRTFNAWGELMAPEFSETVGLRERFYIMKSYADRGAMEIVHDTWAELYNSSLSGLPSWSTALTPMAMSKQFFAASLRNGGTPMDIKPEDGPHIWYEMSTTYSGTDEEDEAIVTAYEDKVSAVVNERLAAAGFKQPAYLYLNDCDRQQDVFAGYPAASVKRLKEIREKYDPEMIFTDQMPGGWKIAHA